MTLTYTVTQVVVQQVGGVDVQFVTATLVPPNVPTFTTNAENATPSQFTSEVYYTVPIDTVVTVGLDIEVTI